MTDGDDDLATYTKQHLPEALHTVDVIHVVEYLYEAGACIYREGSDELAKWSETQKSRLYDGREAKIVADVKRHLASVPATGPGNKGRRERLTKAVTYIEKRLSNMDYKELLERDLELGSGVVEGAVKTSLPLALAKEVPAGFANELKHCCSYDASERTVTGTPSLSGCMTIGALPLSHRESQCEFNRRSLRRCQQSLKPRSLARSAPVFAWSPA